MILKSSIRGNGKQFAHYLLKNKKNEKAWVFGIEGTTRPDNLEASLVEMTLMEELTRSEKGILQIIINPAFGKTLTREQWQETIQVVRHGTDFENQPWAAVMHQYKGHEHMHLSLGRYDYQTETMLNTDHIGLKLKTVRKHLELIHSHEPLLNNWERNKVIQKQAAKLFFENFEDLQQPIQSTKQPEPKPDVEAEQLAEKLKAAQERLKKEAQQKRAKDFIKNYTDIEKSKEPVNDNKPEIKKEPVKEDIFDEMLRKEMERQEQKNKQGMKY